MGRQPFLREVKAEAEPPEKPSRWKQWFAAGLKYLKLGIAQALRGLGWCIAKTLRALGWFIATVLSIPIVVASIVIARLWRYGWGRVLVVGGVLLSHAAAVGLYIHFVQPQVEEYNEAAEAWTEVAVKEASVLDLRGRLAVMEVMYNRLTLLPHHGNFFTDARLVAGAWHINAKTHKPTPDFSGILPRAATQTFISSSEKKVWAETHQLARFAVAGYWVLWHLHLTEFRPILPEPIDFYHNAYPPPSASWMKANDIASCPYTLNSKKDKKFSLIFCRSNYSLQHS